MLHTHDVACSNPASRTIHFWLKLTSDLFFEGIMGFLMNRGKFSKMHSITGKVVGKSPQSGLTTHGTTAARCIHLITS